MQVLKHIRTKPEKLIKYYKLSKSRQKKQGGLTIAWIVIKIIEETRKHLYIDISLIKKIFRRTLLQPYFNIASLGIPQELLPKDENGNIINLWLARIEPEDILFIAQNEFCKGNGYKKAHFYPGFLKRVETYVKNNMNEKDDFVDIFSLACVAVFDVIENGKNLKTVKKKFDSRFSISYEAVDIKFSLLNKNRRMYLHYAHFVRHVPRKSKKKILKEKELLVQAQNSLSFYSVGGLFMRGFDHLKTYRLVNLYSVLINMTFDQKGRFNSEPFSRFYRDSDPKKYIIRKNIPKDYVFSYGMYRNMSQIDIPYQQFDEVSTVVGAYTYVRSMAPPLHTMNYLKNFGKMNLMKVLQKIPNFEYRFTQEQKELISSKFNTVIVGRSGTGKTTCAVLRMVAIQLTAIVQRNLLKGKRGITVKDLDEGSYLKMVFITASPYLARGVERVYKKLINQIREILIKKEKKSKERKEAAEKQEEEANEEEIGEEEEGDVDFENIEERVEKNKNESTKIVQNVMEGVDINALQDDERELSSKIGDLNLDGSSDIPNSLTQVKINNFPLFITLREFFYLLDSLMPKSFFLRTVKNYLKAGITQSGKKGFYRYQESIAKNRLIEALFRPSNNAEEEDFFSDDSDLEDEEAAQEFEDLDLVNFKNSDTSAEIITEVTFEEFKNDFWPLVKKELKFNSDIKKKISSIIAWSKIRNLDIESVFMRNKANVTLKNTDDVKIALHLIKEMYLEWKEKNNSYDLNDIVAKLKRSNEIDYVSRNLIDFLFLDEIQDIPVHILNLMSKFCGKYYYFCGDNAQNITKGVSFKFEKLTKILSSSKSYVDTKYHQLTKNFRSHQKILNLGNSLVQILSILYPDQVETLKEEEGSELGPRPVLISKRQKVDYLVDFVIENFGATKQLYESPGATTGMEEQDYRLNFPSSVCIIVRDSESKERVAKIFERALILTITEVKGLEFKDVILYNFFEDSPTYAAFKLIESMLGIDLDMSEEETESRNNLDTTVNPSKRFIRQCLKKNQVMDFMKKSEMMEEGGAGNEPDFFNYHLYFKKTDKNFFQEVAQEETIDELKLLYVAVTRAKRRLVIFDEAPKSGKHKRDLFEKMWLKTGFCSIVGERDQFYRDRKLAKFDHEVFKNENNLTDQARIENWEKEGIEFMKIGMFDLAKKCFQGCNSDFGEKLAATANNLVRLNRKKNILENLEGWIKDEELQLENKKEIDRIVVELGKCGDELAKFNRYEEAATCYIASGRKMDAVELLKLSGNKQTLAKLYQDLGMFREANEIYNEIGDMFGVMSTLDKTQNFKAILDLLIVKRNEPSLKRNWKSYARKYLSQYIAELENELQSDMIEAVEEEDKKVDELIDSKQKAEEQEKEEIKEDNSSWKDLDDDLSDFEMINSDNGSFKMMDSNLDDNERLSESFVNISFDDNKSAISKGDTFEDLGGVMGVDIPFIENKIITNILKYFKYFDQEINELISGSKIGAHMTDITNPDHNNKDDIVAAEFFEENTELMIKTVEFLQEMNSPSIALMICNRFKLDTLVLKGIVSSALSYSILSIRPALASSNQGIAGSNQRRRITSFAFQSILMGLNKDLIKEKRQKEIALNDQSYISLLVSLGYFRQLSAFLSEKNYLELISDMGELEILVPVYIKINVGDEEERNRLLVKAMRVKRVERINFLREMENFGNSQTGMIEVDQQEDQELGLLLSTGLMRFSSYGFFTLDDENTSSDELNLMKSDGLLGKLGNTCDWVIRFNNKSNPLLDLATELVCMLKDTIYSSKMNQGQATVAGYCHQLLLNILLLDDIRLQNRFDDKERYKQLIRAVKDLEPSLPFSVIKRTLNIYHENCILLNKEMSDYNRGRLLALGIKISNPRSKFNLTLKSSFSYIFHSSVLEPSLSEVLIIDNALQAKATQFMDIFKALTKVLKGSLLLEYKDKKKKDLSDIDKMISRSVQIFKGYGVALVNNKPDYVYNLEIDQKDNEKGIKKLSKEIETGSQELDELRRSGVKTIVVKNQIVALRARIANLKNSKMRLSKKAPKLAKEKKSMLSINRLKQKILSPGKVVYLTEQQKSNIRCIPVFHKELEKAIAALKSMHVIKIDQLYSVFSLLFKLDYISLYYYIKNKYKGRFEFNEKLAFSMLDSEISFKNGFFDYFVQYALELEQFMSPGKWMQAYAERLILVLVASSKKENEVKIHKDLMTQFIEDNRGLQNSGLFKFEEEADKVFKLEIGNGQILDKSTFDDAIRILEGKLRYFEKVDSKGTVNWHKNLLRAFALFNEIFLDQGDDKPADDSDGSYDDSYDSDEFDYEYDEVGLGNPFKKKNNQDIAETEVYNQHSVTLKIQVKTTEGDEKGYNKDILKIQVEKAKRIFLRLSIKRFIKRGSFKIKNYKQNLTSFYNSSPIGQHISIFPMINSFNRKLLTKTKDQGVSHQKILYKITLLKFKNNMEYIPLLSNIYGDINELTKEFAKEKISDNKTFFNQMFTVTKFEQLSDNIIDFLVDDEKETTESENSNMDYSRQKAIYNNFVQKYGRIKERLDKFQNTKNVKDILSNDANRVDSQYERRRFKLDSKTLKVFYRNYALKKKLIYLMKKKKKIGNFRV